MLDKTHEEDLHQNLFSTVSTFTAQLMASAYPASVGEIDNIRYYYYYYYYYYHCYYYDYGYGPRTTD